MSVKIQFPELPRVNRELPLYTALPPSWTAEKVAKLASRFDMKGEVVDAGPWYVCRNEPWVLEVYQASHSLRIERQDIDAEGRDRKGDAPDREAAMVTAKRVMAMIGDEYAKPELHSVTELEVMRATREQREGERHVVGLQVNYRYALDGVPLVGPGAKAQVSVGADGQLMQAYRFARAVERIGARESVAPEEAMRRFAASEMVARLDARAKVSVSSAVLGLLAIPPTEVQSVLVPVYVLRGEISTEALPRQAFVTYVAATELGEADAKRKRWQQVRPGLVTA
ncbi:hypothetical protein ACNI65_12720 [Roseateles sp. So40a]|uniref:hypothetical protein n=1 Tax=Roseateles sp. So40a TaxID=3400226 RepID=UPI003A891A7E